MIKRKSRLFSVTLALGLVLSLLMSNLYFYPSKVEAQAAPGGGGTTYHVGPGQAYTTIGSVPWYNLKAGDTVYIHWKSTPYNEKFLISGQGTPTQWIRVIGVPDPATGALPIISGNGATTSNNNHFRWQDLGGNGIQWDGVVFIAPRSDDANGGGNTPAYIEIANLQIQDAYTTYSFTGENGGTAKYEGFAACIYSRTAKHIIIRNNILTNCGQGFYNWTAGGALSNNNWWEGVQQDTLVSGNYFYNNGHTNSYTEHQIYTEGSKTVIEFNRFGPQRNGAMGSQIKDRSAGTVVRYNYIEQSVNGWDIDLVEPQESWSAVGNLSTYKQAFVYGNTIVNRGDGDADYVHWNEDHQANQGRAQNGGKLFFYNNTVVSIANQSDVGYDTASSKFDSLFNETYGAFDCNPKALSGTVDVRNNIFAIVPRTAGSAVPTYQFGYCGQLGYNFVNNWISPGYTVKGVSSTGSNTNISPSTNNPGFANVANNDFHLVSGSSAIGIAGALAPEVTNNYLGMDLTPNQQYIYHAQSGLRSSYGPGSDAGAFSSGLTSPVPTPTPTPVVTPTPTPIPTVTPTPVVTPTPTPIVTPTPVPTPTPTPVVTPNPSAYKFSIGDTVKTTARINVRQTPGGKSLGLEAKGSTGVVAEGPSVTSTNTWWKINYTDGKLGWSAESYLVKTSVTPTPVPTPTPTPTPLPSITPIPTPVPTVTPTPIVTPTPTVTPTPVVTPTPGVTPIPSVTPTPVPNSSAAPKIKSSQLSSGVDTTAVVKLPSGITAGDLLVIALSQTMDNGFTAPTGWTKKADIGTNFGGVHTVVYSKIAGDNEPTTVNVLMGASSSWGAVAMDINGQSKTNYFEVTPTVASDIKESNVSILAPSISTISSNNLLIRVGATRDASAISSPDGYVDVGEVGGSNWDKVRMQVSSVTQQNIGFSGTTKFVSNGGFGREWTAVTIAIAPDTSSAGIFKILDTLANVISSIRSIQSELNKIK